MQFFGDRVFFRFFMLESRNKDLNRVKNSFSFIDFILDLIFNYLRKKLVFECELTTKL